MGSIVRLNVGEIPMPDQAIWGRMGRVWALWPSPVDHDQCFREAGFDEFADTDADWDRDLAELVSRTVEVLQRLAPGRVSGGEYLLGESNTEALHEAILAGTKEDSLQPPVVSFGEPPLASVRTSDGHAILWIWLAAGDLEQHLALIAKGRDVRTRNLSWDRLLPAARPNQARDQWWKFW